MGSQDLNIAVDQKDLEAFHQKFEQDCIDGCRLLAYLIISAFSIFYLLDLVIVPKQYLFLFGILRLSVCLSAFIILILIKKYGLKLPVKPEIITVYLTLTVGLAVVVMTHFTGGHRSPYYAGISLVLFGVTLGTPMRIGYSLFFNTTIYLAYFFINFFFDTITDWPLFINNCTFLLGNVLFSLLTTQIGYHFRKENFLTNRSLENANNRLKSLDRIKSEFFANISHELNTPVTLILSSVENFSSESTLHTIRQNSHRLSALIQDLLDLSRNEMGQTKLQATKIQNASVYFNAITESITPLMQERGIQWTLCLEEK